MEQVPLCHCGLWGDGVQDQESRATPFCKELQCPRHILGGIVDETVGAPWELEIDGLYHILSMASVAYHSLSFQQRSPTTSTEES